MLFQLVPKSTTSDDLERPLRTLLYKRCIFRSPEDRPLFLSGSCLVNVGAVYLFVVRQVTA